MENNRLHISFAIQIGLISICLVSLTAGFFGYQSYQSEAEQKQQALANELISIVKTTAIQLNVSAHKEISFTNVAGVRGQAGFDQIRAVLAEIGETNNLSISQGSSLFTLRKTDDFGTSNEVELIVMNNLSESGSSYSGERMPAEDLHLQAFSGEAAVTGVYRNPEGVWISAVAPLLDKGEVVGLVQAVRAVEFYDEELSALENQYFVIGMICVSVGVFITWIFSFYVTQPLNVLRRATYVFGDGNYDFQITQQRLDGFDLLYDNFNDMANKIRVSHEDIVRKNEEISELYLELDNNYDETKISLAAKNDFYANMEQEIRTPLNAIVSFSKDLLHINLPPEAKKLLHQVDGAAETLMATTNKILDLSKVGLGKLELVNEDYDLYQDLENMTLMNDEKASERKINLVLRIPRSLPRVLSGDSARTNQILSILIDNAIKFTEKGYVSITAQWHLLEERNIELTFTIADTGIGMTEKACENIFSPFNQADSSIAKTYGGTGVGLSIARGIARRMNGDIEVESAVGIGSTFTVTLTQSLGESVSLSEVENIDESQKTIDANPDKRYYLVIDDCALVGQQLASWLGYENVSYADNIKLVGALYDQAIASGRPFDAIILDHFLDGKEIGQSQWSLRQYGITDVPVFIMMPNGVKLDAEAEALVLDKPLLYANVVDTLNHPEDATTEHSRAVLAVDSDTIAAIQSAEPIYNPMVENKKILLAEDDLNNQALDSFLLDEYGVRFEVVSNGLEAIQKLQEDQFDLVLMDVQMPKMDGITATKLIRDNHKTRDIPVVAMIANTTPIDKDRCFSAGMNDFLPKPVDADHLSRVLDKYLLGEKIDIFSESNITRLDVARKDVASTINAIAANDANSVPRDEVEETSGLAYLLQQLSKKLQNHESVDLEEISAITGMMSNDNDVVMSRLVQQIRDLNNDAAMLTLCQLADSQHISLKAS